MRYLLFFGRNAQACGGCYDLVNESDDLEKAENAVDDAIAQVFGPAYLKDKSAHSHNWWWHVLDTQTMSIVAKHDGADCGKPSRYTLTSFSEDT